MFTSSYSSVWWLYLKCSNQNVGLLKCRITDSLRLCCSTWTDVDSTDHTVCPYILARYRHKHCIRVYCPHVSCSYDNLSERPCGGPVIVVFIDRCSLYRGILGSPRWPVTQPKMVVLGRCPFFSNGGTIQNAQSKAMPTTNCTHHSHRYFSCELGVELYQVGLESLTIVIVTVPFQITY
jgi:hypothetical protein